jgi:hypothetical protein
MNQVLNHKLQKTAFQMFRDWTKNAKTKHPKLDFTIIDESVLVNDLTNSIKSAVTALKSDGKKLKREIPGYDIGFILGFVHANLNFHWVHEYIRKRSDDYKMLMVLKAMQVYLELDGIALIKMDEIYKILLAEDVNFDNIYFKPDKKQFKDFGPDLSANSHNENNIAISLDNLITERIVKIVRKKDLSFLPDTKHYFSEEDVELLIAEF